MWYRARLPIVALIVAGAGQAAPTIAQPYALIVAPANPGALKPDPFRPLAYQPFGPYDLLGGYAPVYLGARQPSGHEIVPLGPNGYIYRPTFDDPPASPFAASPGLPVSPAPLDEAILAFRSGRYAEAVQRLDAALIADPQDGFANLLQSHACFALADYGPANRALDRALALLPEELWGQVLNDYRSFYRATRYTHHLARLEQFVLEHPGEAQGHRLLGYHAGFLGQREAGVAHLAKAVELAPTDVVARRLLAHFGGTVDRGREF